MNKTNLPTRALAFAAAAIFFTNSASAALIASFDVGGSAYTGSGPAGSDATWGHNANVYGAHVDNGVTLSLIGGWPFGGLVSAADTNYGDLTNDYVYSTSGTGITRLSGLDDAKSYDVYVIAPNGTSPGFPANIYGGAYSSGTESASATGGAPDENVWDVGVNYVVLSNLTSSGTVLDINTTINGSQPFFGLAGIQVVEVPEPGSLALLGLGGFMIAARRRRSI